MPALDENSIVTPPTKATAPNRSFSQRVGQRPLQAPPRAQYPWTQTERPTLEKAVPPTPGAVTGAPATAAAAAAASGKTGTIGATTNGVKTVNIGGRLSPISDTPQVDMTGGGAISYQGLMRKRKTKMLRHEWHEHFFTLRGTRLAMHNKDAGAAGKTLEYIDVDDYAIACSGAAGTSKLNAAFKAMHIRRGSGDDGKGGHGGDVAAFSFQLIPQDAKGGVKLLRKRESALPAGLAAAAAASGNGVGALAAASSNTSTTSLPPPIEGAVNGTGKTHHFAVKGRDERIDWMRELMLARARKQKGEGFEVSVNGNMI